MTNIKQHDSTLLVADASIFIATCLSAYFCRRPHIHCDTYAPNANFKNIAAKFVCILTKMPTIHYRHLHQYQQWFVILNSPLLFDAAPQTRCISQITYPEPEAEEQRSFHKRQQLAEPLTHLFIYLSIYHSAIMRNLIQTSCLNSPVFTWSSASTQSIYLLHMALFSAPSNHCPPCSTLKSICLTLRCF